MIYIEISKQTGYSRMQISRLNIETGRRNINSILIHGNKSRKTSITASDQEVELTSTLAF